MAQPAGGAARSRTLDCARVPRKAVDRLFVHRAVYAYVSDFSLPCGELLVEVFEIAKRAPA
jgi:hypothetical protein